MAPWLRELAAPRELGIGFYHPHGGMQLSATLLADDVMSSAGLLEEYTHLGHRQNTHTHK